MDGMKYAKKPSTVVLAPGPSSERAVDVCDDEEDDDAEVSESE